MRETERPIAFKPWIYEIAKNACIDQFRRTRRAEEISYDADERMAPADLGRLADTGPVPEVAAEHKQELDNLVGAFGGLSRSHHDILVLRELEGLTYRQIGERMGLSRPSVESTLFRARRRLGEEYDDLTTGRRCERVRSAIAALGDEPLGVRDRGRVSRHLAHCQPCRRHAVREGVPAELFERPSTRTRVAALLPFPVLLRPHTGGGSSADSAGTATSHLPAIANVAASGDPAALWSKAAAAGLTIMVAAGASVATHAIIGAAPVQRAAPATGAPVVPASDHPRSGAGAQRVPAGRGHRSARHGSRTSHGTGAKRYGAGAGHTRSLGRSAHSATGGVVHVSSTLRSAAPRSGRGGAAAPSYTVRSYPGPALSRPRPLGAGTVSSQVGALQLVGGRTLRGAHAGSAARRLLQRDSAQSPPQRAKR
jgi:RNA polymerase sigma factor (sigma-70 family)